MSRPPADPSKCVVCGKDKVAQFKPFCSKRCADLDLGKWLGGRYAIPAEEPPDGPLNGAEDDD